MTKLKHCEADVDDCILDECRFFDPETGQYGYEIVCFNNNHKHRVCPREGEMFRNEPEGWWVARRRQVVELVRRGFFNGPFLDIDPDEYRCTGRLSAYGSEFRCSRRRGHSSQIRHRARYFRRLWSDHDPGAYTTVAEMEMTNA